MTEQDGKHIFSRRDATFFFFSVEGTGQYITLTILSRTLSFIFVYTDYKLKMINYKIRYKLKITTDKLRNDELDSITY